MTDGSEEYRFLEEEALKLGCEEVRIIPADQVIVENRVRLKCMVGCPTYGKNLRCPPNTPNVEEFRRMLSEYSYAMLLKIKRPEIPPDDMYQYLSFYNDKINILLELEKVAFKEGYNFTTSFFAGSCKLCEECNVDGDCINPNKARYSMESMGINAHKTADNAGMELEFDTVNYPPSISLVALLLID